MFLRRNISLINFSKSKMFLRSRRNILAEITDLYEIGYGASLSITDHFKHQVSGSTDPSWKNVSPEKHFVSLNFLLNKMFLRDRKFCKVENVSPAAGETF